MSLMRCQLSMQKVEESESNDARHLLERACLQSQASNSCWNTDVTQTTHIWKPRLRTLAFWPARRDRNDEIETGRTHDEVVMINAIGRSCNSSGCRNLVNILRIQTT